MDMIMEQNLEQKSINTEAPEVSDDLKTSKRQKNTAIIVGGLVFLFIAALVAALIFLLSPNTDQVLVTRLRDVFIIILASESLLIGLSLVILMRLINLMNNEIKPILDSTNDTVNTLRGTTAFLSNNLVEPVMKLNEYMASFQEMLRIFKRK
jgi:uncharacterized membrane protein